MKKLFFACIAALRGARSLAVIQHTVSASARRAPCTASQIYNFLGSNHVL